MKRNYKRIGKIILYGLAIKGIISLGVYGYYKVKQMNNNSYKPSKIERILK